MPAVVLLHGLGPPGAVMGLMALRLRNCGFKTHIFSWHEFVSTLEENAQALHGFCSTLPGEQIHFVAHSLGGLVVLRMLTDHPDHRPGRVVLLGTPYTGSYVARTLSALPVVRHLLGRSVSHGLLNNRPLWQGGRELGIIAGARPFGIGHALIPGVPRPNDGMVSVEETRVPGATDHLVMRVGHSGMLVSRQVARQVCAFLEQGKFLR